MTPLRSITIEVDSELALRLHFIAEHGGMSHEELLARILDAYVKGSGRRSLNVGVSEDALARLAAAAATSGMREEELIADAIDTYSPPEISVRSGLVLGIWALLFVLPPALMFLSPPIGRSASALAWIVFAAAMVACFLGVLLLVVAVVYAEWVVIKYGVVGLIAAAGCGTAAALSAFAYLYWLLSNLAPASFNTSMSRVDAIYFVLGTFTTTGTGSISAQSGAAELLVSCQVVLGWGFVAVILALLVPRAAGAYGRLSNGRIIVRIDKKMP
jgi:predicted transcriptional regulator